MSPAETEVTELARSFETMGLEDLRKFWRGRYGAPPTLRSVQMVRHLLAWRVQAEALGGIDRRTVQQIMAAARTKRPRKAAAPAGSVIVREWQGVAHQVEVKEGGYLYDGRSYKSLSAIARLITGVRWNGPRFFGLRDEAKESVQ